MKILIASSTVFEVKPLLNFLGVALPEPGVNHANMDFEEKDIHVLITGVGMVNTALMMGRHLNSSYDLVINVGVCGAFDRDIELGQLVRVSTDRLSELGAEDGDEFLRYDQLNLPGESVFSESYKVSYPMIDRVKKVNGITVNKVHGNDESIKKIKQLFNPDVESMEGAAFFAACQGIGQNYIQIRAVSNYVERRDKSKWQMALAIENLNDFLVRFIKNV